MILIIKYNQALKHFSLFGYIYCIWSVWSISIHIFCVDTLALRQSYDCPSRLFQLAKCLRSLHSIVFEQMSLGIIMLISRLVWWVALCGKIINWTGRLGWCDFHLPSTFKCWLWHISLCKSISWSTNNTHMTDNDSIHIFNLFGRLERTMKLWKSSVESHVSHSPHCTRMCTYLAN